MGCNNKKSKQQSKLMRIVRAPIKVLSKARDFYIKGMEDWSGRVGDGGFMSGPTAHVSHFSKNFSVNSIKSRASDEEFKELLRVTSRRAMMMRSYSVGIGKIGRIDEEKPCDFEEEDYLVYSRSRSCALRRANVVLHC